MQYLTISNPANLLRVFHVETTWKRPLPPGIHLVCLQGKVGPFARLLMDELWDHS